MSFDRRHVTGPFDIIGDVHGCADELAQLLDTLGYADSDGVRRHPAGRRALFVGDLVNRGPRNLGTVDLIAPMISAGTALSVQGNHDHKVLSKLDPDGCDRWPDFAALSADDRARRREQVRGLLTSLHPYLILDGGALVVAHAGLPLAMHGLDTPEVRRFARMGRPTGEHHPDGRPVRWDWANEYDGSALVVYGHTPVERPRRVNNTVNVDTGCVYGGALSALRYPEGELLSVPARAAYFGPKRQGGRVV